MSTCLIIAFYIGKRDSCTHKQAESYINIHLTYLKKIIHSYQQVRQLNLLRAELVLASHLFS